MDSMSKTSGRSCWSFGLTIVSKMTVFVQLRRYLCTPYINRDAPLFSHLFNILILFLLIIIKLNCLHHIYKNELNLFSVPIYVQYINRDSVNISGTVWRKVAQKPLGTLYTNWWWSVMVSWQLYIISAFYRVLNSYVEFKLEGVLFKKWLECT